VLSDAAWKKVASLLPGKAYAGGAGVGDPAFDAAQLARGLGPASGITASERPAGAASTLSVEQAEIRRLQKELERAQMERDILKEAIGILSGPPR
jgi:transposase